MLSYYQKERLMKVIFFVICGLILMVFLMPYIYLILSSFKPAEEVVASPPSFLPKKLSLKNYTKMFEYMPISLHFTNSMIASVVSVVVSLIIGSLAAYGTTRFSSKISKTFLIISLCMRLIPLISITIPIYEASKALGIYDTKLVLIIGYTAINVPFVIWMMSGFFEGLPKSLDEAARIDGCTRVSAFFRIIVPITLPGLATTMIFAFMMSWNDFMYALFMTSTNSKTVPVGISEFLTAYSLDLGPMTAAAVIFSLPIMILSFFIQKYIVSGMTMGAVKG